MKTSIKSFFLILFLIASLASPSMAAWDKTKPAGSRSLNQVDDDIRANNDAIESALDQDHDFTTGGTQTGKHQQVVFKAVLGSKPSLSADEGALYTKAVSSKTQLFFEDEDAVESIISIPAGIIVPFVPGYFTNGSNGGFTYQWVSANTIAAVNTLLNPKGWYVCDGAALNLADSVYFNGAGRYLPNLTDDRFLMGDTLAGGTGGANTHTHTVYGHTHTTGDFRLNEQHIPAHRHFTSNDVAGSSGDTQGVPVTNAPVHGSTSRWNFDAPGYSSATGGDQVHNHGPTGNNGNAATSLSESRPSYLSCFYIMKVM
jgi:hypothetical protein